VQKTLSAELTGLLSPRVVIAGMVIEIDGRYPAASSDGHDHLSSPYLEF
jgi:hypothetical protein